MRRRAIVQHADGHINVTPMIDVVMCLIVFYLIVGKLAAGQLSPVDLPDSGVGREERDPQVLVVNIGVAEAPGADGESAGPAPAVSVDGRDVADALALEALVRQRLMEHPETVVHVRGSRRLSYGQVRPYLLACARAGAPSVELAAERSIGGGP